MNSSWAQLLSVTIHVYVLLMVSGGSDGVLQEGEAQLMMGRMLHVLQVHILLSPLCLGLVSYIPSGWGLRVELTLSGLVSYISSG